MNINPKQIAKMISEDPNEIDYEVNPLDDTEDEYVAEPGFCDGCLRDRSYDDLGECQKCGHWWCDRCMVSNSYFDWEEEAAATHSGGRDPFLHPSSCPNCNI
jgi:hypothetical protein